MRILLAVDHSETSALASEEVASRPWPPESAVRVLSVVEPITPPAAELWYDAAGSLERAREDLTRRATGLAMDAADKVRRDGLAAEAVVREGDPREAIIDEARDWQADLIVVGSHGYTGLKRFLLGSVAQSVVSHAPCSVEVVRDRTDGANAE
jgi:nucleotide-binding universal stress UspA family protein